MCVHSGLGFAGTESLAWAVGFGREGGVCLFEGVGVDGGMGLGGEGRVWNGWFWEWGLVLMLQEFQILSVFILFRIF